MLIDKENLKYELMLVLGIGSIAFVIFLIAQKKQPFLFSFVEFREGCFCLKYSVKYYIEMF